MKVTVIDGGPDGSAVVGELNADDTITVVRDVDDDQPEHGQVSVMVDGVYASIVYADITNGEWTVQWPSGLRERVRFTGARVCPRCLHHCGGEHAP